MTFKDLLAKLGQNIDKSDENLSTVVAQNQDRIRMMNPDVQGPQLPGTTPEETQYYEDVTDAVAGAVQPVGKTKEIGKQLLDNTENYFSKQIPNVKDKLNTLADAFGPHSQSARKEQQELARKLYQEERERAYREQKLRALKKLSGI